MLVFACEGRNLFDLGGSDVAWVNPAHASSLHMDFEHDLRCAFSVHRKKSGENEDNEFHGGEIIVEQQHRIKRWWRQFAAFFGENGVFVMRLGHKSILPSLLLTMREN